MGLFSADGAEIGAGIVQTFISYRNQPINSLTTTARPDRIGKRRGAEADVYRKPWGTVSKPIPILTRKVQPHAGQ